MSPFIDPYPPEYVQLVLTPGYQPDLPTFIADFHKHNPDRNRPLDMYPLFAALNNEQLQQYSNLGKVKARKSFHYRLPNSSIPKPDWTLAQEWDNWVAIEELAFDTEKMNRMGQEYLDLKKNTFLGFETKWAKKTQEWLMV